MARLSGPSLLWRQLVAHATPAVGILVGIAFATGIVTALPRAVDSVSTEDLRAGIAAAPPERRHVVLERLTSIVGRRDEPFWLVREEGDRFLDDAGPEIQAVVTDHHYVIDSPRWEVEPLPTAPSRPFDTTVHFRWQQDLDRHRRLTGGREAAEADPVELLFGRDCPTDADEREEFQPVEDVDCRLEEVPVYEVTATETTARDLQMEIGDEVLLQPDPTDRLYNASFRPGASSVRLVMRLVGEFELDPIDDPYWFADDRLHRPRITENPDYRIIDAAVVTHDQAYNSARVLIGHPAYRYHWRYRVGADQVTPANAPALADALVAVELAEQEAASATERVEVITGLPGLIEEFVDQRRQAIAVSSIGVAGLILTAAMLIALLGVLRERQERSVHALVRGRGATRSRLLATKLVQATILGLLGAVTGFGVSLWLFPSTGHLQPLAIGAAMAAVSVIAVVTPTVPAARGAPAIADDTDRSSRLRGRRRLVVEFFVIALAVGAVLTLRRRGAIDRRETDIDPLLAIAPALVAAVLVIVVLRFLGPTISAVARLGRRTRGFVSFLVLRQAADDRFATRMPVLVVMVALTLSVFATTTAARMREGQEIASHQTVGADYRLATQADGLAFTAPIDLDGVPGVDGWSEAAFLTTPRVDPLGAPRVTPVLAIDAGDHVTVADPRVLSPDAVRALSSDRSGGASDPLPVLVTRDWIGGDRPALGDAFELSIGAIRVDVEVVGVTERIPGMPGRPAELVIDLATLRRLNPNPIRPTLVFAQGAPDALDRIEAAIPAGSNALITSRHQVLASISEDPFVRATRTTLRTVVVAAAVVALFATLAALVLLAQTRRRDHGIVRTLGAELGRVRALILFEQVPVLGVAILAGVIGGVFVGWVLGPALVLDGFTGGVDSVPGRADWRAIGLSVSTIMGSMVAAALAFARLDRRRSLDNVVRIGDPT